MDTPELLPVTPRLVHSSDTHLADEVIILCIVYSSRSEELSDKAKSLDDKIYVQKCLYKKKLQLQIEKPGLASAPFTLRMVVFFYD